MLQRTLHLYQRAYQGLSPSVWLLAIVMLINRCGTMVLPFMTLYLTQHLHYSVTDAGIIMALFGAGAFIGTFIGGRLTDRFGFYYIQLFSLMFGGFALIGLQFVTNFYLLCGSIFTFTLFGDSFRPANQAAIAHYSDPETRTRAFSLNRLAINLGWAVGGALGGWLASIDYSLLFWVDGLTCLVASIVLWISLPVPSRPKAKVMQSITSDLSDPVATSQSPYQDTLFIGFVVCSALYLMVFMQLFSIVPLFFKEVLGLNEQLIGRLMALNGILIVLFEMALVYSLEQQKRPKTTLIIVGSLLTALAYLALALPINTFLSGIHIALLFILFATLGEMLSIPFLQSFTVERSNPATRGQYLALYGMGASFAQTTAPIFGSFLVAQAGFSVHWPIAASLILASSCGFLWLGKVLKQKEARELSMEQSSESSS
ncbi:MULTISPECIES: MFS transporter [unclassified Spirosoma]|uniref:MDR family MFS transporter n=1 Tax=unclassified Spirosoma TaxID=2621999 RepID=UPI000962A3A2|nr:MULTISPECIES: MFS transporter [unclassified Spirosoma]MBN8821699.1 MFS transporter [Spirosoma sp.]OJW80804.1 MAG: MFS transporter [Spirosoma sp. 48-14]